MARRVFHIAGQAPKVKWKRNPRRKKRTIEEAIAIAEQHGVDIPADVKFFEAPPGELSGTLEDLLAGGDMETARGPRVTTHADGYIYWRDHYHPETNTIPFLVHPDILTSDEAIVGTFTHEMYELSEIRQVCLEDKMLRMNATDYELQVKPHLEGNFHDEAWEAADKAVLRMRKGKQ